MKRAELIYQTDGLLADISARCRLAARAAGADGKNVSDTEDVLDDGNREVVTDLMSRLMTECVSLLYPFVKTPVRSRRSGGAEEEAEEYVIVLDFPYERSETDVQQIRRCVHDYIVYECLAEWLALTLPGTGQSQVWEEKAQEVREQTATLLVLPLCPKTLRVKQHFY